MALTTPVEERRRFSRSDSQPRFGINLLNPQGSVAADSVNFSEGGLCLRLQETLEVRSLVRLQLIPAGRESVRGQRLPQCNGRVTWVIQRLDLRSLPPFLYDVGIEFVDPPPSLRQLMAQSGMELGGSRERSVQETPLASAVIRSRHYIPRLERAPNHALRWHLVVTVDGVPCFSSHYPSERAAIAGWTKFKRQQARR